MKKFFLAFTLIVLLTGCGKQETPELVELGGLIDQAVPLAAAPDFSSVLTPVASGIAVKEAKSARIDFSNQSDGYIMMAYQGTKQDKIKARITGPSGTTYTYNLRSDGVYDTFPLSDGNGIYQAEIFKNVEGTKYSKEVSTSLTVQLKDEFAPFVRPNQYVNFNESSKVVGLAQELTQDKEDTLQKVEAVYNYVIQTITYDYELAANVQSGYLPNVDQVLEKKKGICFDYAAVMAAMLRSQKIPTKLVVGYTGSVYHAWIDVYSDKEGWIDGLIYFNGTNWKLMDPTFAANSQSDQTVMQYIGNGSNYQAKYLY